jgi:23S rRNA (adenine2030-N6)-methyltransferase
VNYRHAFHAGNFADVHKHVVLLALLERLKQKPKPLLYLDTHAGRGSYDLRAEDATRSGESREGIARLAGHPVRSADLLRYLQATHAASTTPTRYPGSPLIALGALREGDRAVLVEQQPAEAQALQQATSRMRDVSIVCGDGYAALKTYLPPRENRGLVLIDPPYEADTEFADARPADSPIGLNGSGLVIANPPWKFDGEMREALEELHAALEGKGASRVEWLVGE